MSKQLARAISGRLNMQPVLVSVAHTDYVADGIRSLVEADSREEKSQKSDRVSEMMGSYGYDAPSENKPFAYADGIAFIPVQGLLLNRFSESWSSVTGYNFVRNQLNAALIDDDVKLIVFDVNSNGGEVAGCFELCDEIFASRKKKPSCAVVDSNCYSAGYAIASSAGKVITIPSAGVGSVGVVATHISFEKMLTDAGIKVTFIYSGDHKVDGNMYQDLPKSVKADIQARVDKTRTKFVELVARNRNLDAQAVRATEARCYDAEEALSLGLIDSIAMPSEAVLGFFDELSGSITNDEDSIMSTQSDQATSGAESTAATQAAAAASAAQAAAPTAAQTNAADARAAERERIAAITGCEEAKERSQLANHIALKTNLSVDEAKGMLAAAPVETKPAASANPFAAAMEGTGNPNVGADGGSSAEGAGTEESAAQRILKAQAAVCGTAQ